MFQFRGQQLEQVLVDIVLSPYILICLAEQLWVGQAIDACLHTATNEAFASCPQLINLLRSSNSTLSSLLLSSHFASELRATVFDLFNSWGNISTHVPRKVHIYINTYVTSCTWTISKHINSCTTKSAQRINTYVTSCTRTIRKHINSCTAKRAQRINTNVTSMKMNSILEIRCIRLFCDSVNCSPSDLNFWILQFERLEDEIFTPVKHVAKIDRASRIIVEKNN